MNHVHLTCKNHPNLRWQCKSIAYSEGYGYNGSRNIFFNGELAVNPSDRSWPYRDQAVGKDGNWHSVPECSCPPTDLVLAPESDKPDYS